MIDLTFDSTDEDENTHKSGEHADNSDIDFDEIPSSQTIQASRPVKLSLKKKIVEKQHSKRKENKKIKENGIINAVSKDIKLLTPIVLVKKLKVTDDKPKNRKSPRKSYALRSKRKAPSSQPQNDFNTPTSKKRSRPTKGFTLDEWEWSTNDVAKEYDRKNGFYPEAGPSNYNFYERTIIPAFLVSPVKNDKREKLIETSPIQTSDVDGELNANSFYDTSYIPSPTGMRLSPFDLNQTICRTPVNDIQFCMPSTAIVNKLNEQFSTICSNKDNVQIKPKNLPPTFTEVLDSMGGFNIPEVVAPTPFYSNKNDLTDKQEVGHTVLRIPAKDELEEFESTVSDGGLKAWRQKCFNELTNEDTVGIDMQTICEILASEKQIVVSPHVKPPLPNLAIKWLQQNCSTESDVINICEDSLNEKCEKNNFNKMENGNQCDIRTKSKQSETKSTNRSSRSLQSQPILNGSISRNVTTRRGSYKIKPNCNKTMQENKPSLKTVNHQNSIEDEIVCLSDSDDSENAGDSDVTDCSQLSNGHHGDVSQITKQQIRTNGSSKNGIHSVSIKMSITLIYCKFLVWIKLRS